MTLFLALLGGLSAALGVIGVVRPETLLLLVHSAWRSKWALYYAVTSRLALGLVALLAAPDCRFPQAIRVIGFLSLAAAVVLLLTGYSRVTAFIGWWQARNPALTRIGALATAVFGVFLVYAAV